MSAPLDFIRQNVQAVQDQGVQIIYGDFGVRYSRERGRFISDNNCCCPLGAVLLNQSSVGSDQIWAALQQALGVDHFWVDGFWSGFDDAACGGERELPPNLPTYAEGYVAGQQLAAELGDSVIDEDEL